MPWDKARKLLSGVFGRDDDAPALSRRDILAGIGLAGLFVAAPKLLSSPAEASTINTPPVEPPAGSSDTADAKVTEHSALERDATDTGEMTDVSAQYWRRRRRRYWRRRYRWRRRYWRRRYWRRRYW
jgi:hypothetical protein